MISFSAKENRWPRGLAWVQYSDTKGAEEAMKWIKSDPENPVSFFGRPIRAQYGSSAFKTIDPENRRGPPRRSQEWTSRNDLGQTKRWGNRSHHNNEDVD